MKTTLHFLFRAGALTLLLVSCQGGDDGGGRERPVPPVQADVASMDAIGDSISVGFNAAGEGDEEDCRGEIERRNWSTGDTHGSDFCRDGGEGVFSHVERLECIQSTQVMRADPNSALSGARMLTEFADQSRSAAAFFAGQPEPRYVTILIGHNDICGGTVDATRSSCPHGADEDPDNHCRTTPAAFERELRKGLDELIQVPSLRIGVGAIVRVSLLCAHGDKDPCIPELVSCQEFWRGAVEIGAPDDRGVCGSLTRDCSDARISSAYQMARAYRDVLERVAGEYAAVPAGGTSPAVTVGGELAGGATKASGVEVAFSNATWRGRFEESDVSCCDCFHPSAKGQDRLSRVLMEGITCGDSDVCCADTGDPVVDGRCGQEDRGGAFVPGLFPRTDS